MLNLERFRSDVDGFSQDSELEYYLNWSGQKDELNLSGIYEKYGHLFDKRKILEIRQLRSKKGKGREEDRKLRYLQGFVTHELLSQHVKELTDISYTTAAKEVIKVDGEEIPFRLAEVMYFNEDNRTKRAKIFDARNKAIEEKLEPVLRERMEKLHGMSRELGYKNYLELYRDTKSINFEELDNAMTSFVQKTDSLWVEKMGEKLKQVVGVELGEAEKHDATYVFRAKQFDSYFKEERALGILDKTLRGMGFIISQHKNIMIDMEKRPRKDPRAFTAVIKVPDDVRLVFLPKGGQDDYAAMLHEAGHTVHHASVDPLLPVEYKRLGDASVTETYAFLMEYLSLNTAWLKENIGLRELDSYLDFAYLYKMYFLRRYAAKLKYELLLHGGQEIGGMGKVYRETLEQALKFRHPEAHYLTDLDDGFYSTQYLRAWIFEAQLRSKIIERYGKTWFKNPEAGRFLAELWSSGQKYDVEELARRIGFKGLDARPILTEIEEHFEQSSQPR
ncbi:MAG: hypothetical protein WED04_07020 [Promethearchaeati archaeon SRVP18_Atabeyarchaeia-1]